MICLFGVEENRVRKAVFGIFYVSGLVNVRSLDLVVFFIVGIE